ncbi:MAG: recombination mediator RecR [Patescibacteria group bacterium]|jgi:recombination protein RecR
MALPDSIQNLIAQFNKLPGIGQKTAERFVFYLLKQPKSEIDEFVKSLNGLKNNIKICSECFDFSETSPCSICRNSQRDKSIICAVAQGPDVIALEKTSEYNGVYHVLNGLINQIEGIGPEKLRVKELINRLKKNGVKEVILALDATMEGETTAMYLIKEIKPLNIKITRLARGLPMGSDIEYADEITLSSALKGRREI